MIYLDSSVILAQLLSEDRVPPKALWRERLFSSHLLQYEVWNRINSRHLQWSHGEDVRVLIGLVTLIDLRSAVLMRALEPFPIAVRTLDALHLATLAFLRADGQTVALASYDERLLAAARLIGIDTVEV